MRRANEVRSRQQRRRGDDIEQQNAIAERGHDRRHNEEEEKQDEQTEMAPSLPQDLRVHVSDQRILNFGRNDKD